MKSVIVILLILSFTKACPLKSKKQQTSIKRCYKTITSNTISSMTSTFSSSTFISTRTTSITTETIEPTESTETTEPTEPTETTETIEPTETTETTETTSDIPITSGKNATLTYFTDTVTQCYGGDIPVGNGLAVNPLLLGFTLSDWNDKYSNADSNTIPWCGKMMNVTVNGNTYSARIIDTCNPGDEGAFIDPNTGQVIGGKCDYMNVIDLYGEAGLSFLQNTVGDDFYQGDLEWVIY